MIAGHQLRHWFGNLIAPDRHIREKYASFKELLRYDAEALDIVAELDTHLYGHNPADRARIRHLCQSLTAAVRGMTGHLIQMNPGNAPMVEAVEKLAEDVAGLVKRQELETAPPYVIPLTDAAGRYSVAGGKAANLALAKQAGAPTPDGFVITASAFFRYLHDNGLEREIEKRFQSVRLSRHDIIIQITGELQELILAAEVPEDIAAQIRDAVRNMNLGSRQLAVRSSALAEDGEISFAGQYASELDVDPEDILSAYKRVMAGKYCPRAVAYRVRHGLTDNATAMASLVLPMMDAWAGGVAYTCDPGNPAGREETFGVYMVDGLAAELVDGSATPGKYVLTRDNAPHIIAKSAQVERSRVPDAVVCELGAWGMRLEQFFGRPQDVEWTFGPEGLQILQTRPLQQDKDKALIPVEEIGSAEVLLRDLDCASPGAACGSVHIVPGASAFRRIPHGAVVITDCLRPALSQFLDRIAAIIARNGSRASHLSSVARERGVPVLVGDASSLREGMVVTVDGAAGVVYDQCLAAIMDSRQAQEKRQALVRSEYVELISKTVHLHLLNSESPEFTPEGCRSLHDVIRYCHEKSVAAMFSLVGRQGRGLGRSRRLNTHLPLAMYALDLGGGISRDAGRSGDVELEHVISSPMTFLWAGLGDERIAWDSGQLHIDWEEFDRVSAGLFKADSRMLASYAVVASDYMHLNIRFGYHFSVVDALCGDNPGANYVKFRFKGGGSGMEQRGYRLVFISRVLERFAYETRITGDMLDAVCQRLGREQTGEALRALGLILAITRLMDVKLASEADARREAEAFLARFYPELLP